MASKTQHFGSYSLTCDFSKPHQIVKLLISCVNTLLGKLSYFIEYSVHFFKENYDEIFTLYSEGNTKSFSAKIIVKLRSEKVCSLLSIKLRYFTKKCLFQICKKSSLFCRSFHHCHDQAPFSSR